MTYAHPAICVIGGGFTGAAAAIACLNRLEQPFHLTMVDPSAALGRGVAFGGHHPLHLLNVRTRDLSVFADRPGDFLNWAFRQLDQGENDAGLLEGLGHTFLPRQMSVNMYGNACLRWPKGDPTLLSTSSIHMPPPAGASTRNFSCKSTQTAKSSPIS